MCFIGTEGIFRKNFSAFIFWFFCIERKEQNLSSLVIVICLLNFDSRILRSIPFPQNNTTTKKPISSTFSHFTPPKRNYSVKISHYSVNFSYCDAILYNYSIIFSNYSVIFHYFTVTSLTFGAKIYNYSIIFSKYSVIFYYFTAIVYYFTAVSRYFTAISRNFTAVTRVLGAIKRCLEIVPSGLRNAFCSRKLWYESIPLFKWIELFPGQDPYSCICIILTGQLTAAFLFSANSSSPVCKKNIPFFSLPPIKTLLPSFLEILQRQGAASTQALHPIHLER